jgi:hypothetical protein
MSRDEEAFLNITAGEAKRRLHAGIAGGRLLVEQYRARLLAMKAADELLRGRLLIARSASRGRG